ncbi:uncharacterized protein METZ01_LOCUS401706, partial [marine metagenome]
ACWVSTLEIRMDWDKLRVFHAVTEAGSFTRAGDLLHLSQSAVSRQVAALERSLSVVLFHRHSRGLILTEQGETLYATARDIYAKLAMTEANLSGGRDRPEGPLTISTTNAFGTIWLTPRLCAFNQLYPGIDLKLKTSDDALDLSMREADVAIRMGTPTQPDLIQRHLMTVHSHIYAAPSYLEKFGPIESADDLLSQRLIVYGEGPLSDIASPNWLLRRSGEAESRHLVVLEVNNIYCILRAVESGLGISALPDYVARERPNILQILPELQGPSFDAYLVYAEE